MTRTINTNQISSILDMDIQKVRKRIASKQIPVFKKAKQAITTPTAVEYFSFITDSKPMLDKAKRKAKTISFVNHKGGCSKTTTAYTIASLLYEFGNKVLLVDFDPQGNATHSVLKPTYNDEGIIIPHEKTIKDLILEKKNYGDVHVDKIKEVIKKSKFGFDAIPCDLSLNNIITDLGSSFIKEILLKELLAEIESDYDYIIIDTPPTLGFSVISALNASDYIMIVSLAEAYSLIGIQQTLKLIEETKEQSALLVNKKNIDLLGIVISKVEIATNISKYHLQELEDLSKENNIKLFKDNFIPKTTKIPETQATGELITDVDPKSDAAISYFNIALEIDMKVKKDILKQLMED